jgi:NAD(P)-dependent dehydrogenase (short-subunit alcohol dehydrogenase family)
MNHLEGTTALVTGAGKGLGAAIATRFAEQGAMVIVNDLVLDDAQSIASKVHGHAIAADVSDPASVASMLVKISGLSSQFDILENNAGISGMGPDEVQDLGEKRKKQAEELSTTGKSVPSSIER